MLVGLHHGNVLFVEYRQNLTDFTQIFDSKGLFHVHTSAILNFAHMHYIRSKISLAKLDLTLKDARFMQMHNSVLTREEIINSMFPVDRMRELNFHRETAVCTRSLARLVDSLKLFFDFRLLSAFDSFWRAIDKRNGVFCC